MDTVPIWITDLEKLAAAESPDLADIVGAFVEQDDPEPKSPPREGAFTFSMFQSELRRAAARRSPRARREASTAAWKHFLAQTDPPPPPRFELAGLLVSLYERKTEASRRALVAIAADAPLSVGIWGGLKRIYKRAEAAHDFEMFASLAVRFDLETSNRHGRDDRIATRGTLVYLRHRAWRYVRRLGQAVPQLYAMLAAQVLARLPAEHAIAGLHLASNIVGKAPAAARKLRRRSRGAKKQTVPAAVPLPFEAAWKLSPDPLTYLIAACSNEFVAEFGITCLRKYFPDVLRAPDVAWLEKLCYRPVEPVNDLCVELLSSTPELHQAKLRERGLHDAVLALLTSPSEKARKYAIAYARAHAKDLSVEQLLGLADGDNMEERFGATYEETITFAVDMLQSRAPRTLGLDVLGRMLGIGSTSAWARDALLKTFGREEVPEAWLVDQLYGSDAQADFVETFIEKKYPGGSIGSPFWTRVLDDPRQPKNETATDKAMSALGKLALASMDATWILTALTRESLAHGIGQMLQKADALPPGIDVERLKGFVFHPAHREVALAVLGNPKLVKPRDLGLGWLLALGRRADTTLHDFAHRILLQNMKPADFDDAGKYEAGVNRLFALAAGAKEPEPVRLFAQTYLRCHHPILGPSQPETSQLGLTPMLDRGVFSAARVWPMLWDERPDVRKFALAVARAELRAWDRHTRIYELGDSEAKEVRSFAHEALLGAGDATADPACTLKPEELSAAGVLGMAESRQQRTREIAMELFRRHYAQLGGADKLGWLMQSADREVQKFAVRLLWEKHRPRALPAEYVPAKRSNIPFERAGDFTDTDALGTLLRRTLFALPPGRAKEAAEGQGRRRIPQSVVKRNVVEIVRDLALDDASFAATVVPIFMEMVGSTAKGEYQACLAALARIDHAHPGLVRFANGGT